MTASFRVTVRLPCSHARLMFASRADPSAREGLCDRKVMRVTSQGVRRSSRCGTPRPADPATPPVTVAAGTRPPRPERTILASSRWSALSGPADAGSLPGTVECAGSRST
ncbi:hypothetical protein GCM10023083_38650 [Streptomyces phyllanthi]